MVREAAAQAESAVPRNRAANQNTPISFINFGSLAAGHQTLDVTRESKQTSIVSREVVSGKKKAAYNRFCIFCCIIDIQFQELFRS